MEKQKGIHVIKPEDIEVALASRDSQQLIEIAKKIHDTQTSLSEVIKGGRYGLIPQVIGQLRINVRKESQKEHKNVALIANLNERIEELSCDAVEFEECIDIRSSSVGSQMNDTRTAVDSWTGTKGRMNDAA